MPRVKRRPPDSPIKMPKGFYLKKGIWYKRILKPDPRTGAWTLQAESTHCKAAQRQGAIDYVARRTAELDADFEGFADLRKISIDRGVRNILLAAMLTECLAVSDRQFGGEHRAKEGSKS